MDGELHAMLINWCRYKLSNLIILMLLSSSVHAVDMTYGMDVSLGRYENINLVSNPVSEEWVQRVRGTFKLVENSSNLIANVDASLSIINYSNNQQQDDVSSNVNALGRWIIKPKQFEWLLSDVYTQTIINQFQSINQSNIQNINVFSTGPNPDRSGRKQECDCS